MCECVPLHVIEWVCKNLLERDLGVYACLYVCVCVCAPNHAWTKRRGLFFFFSTLSKALPVERRILGWPPPTHRYEAVMGRIAAFIE